MRRLAPPKSEIPTFLVIQPIVVEYSEEYIVVDRIDTCV